MHLLQQVRSSSRSPRPLPQIILHTVLAALLGALLGFLAKYADSISIIGHIGTRLGIWIFLATMLAAFSPSPHAAAVSTFSFFAGMLGAYYAYSSVLFGFFPRHYVLAWGFFALLSPLGAYLVWFSRGRG